MDSASHEQDFSSPQAPPSLSADAAQRGRELYRKGWWGAGTSFVLLVTCVVAFFALDASEMSSPVWSWDWNWLFAFAFSMGLPCVPAVYALVQAFRGRQLARQGGVGLGLAGLVSLLLGSVWCFFAVVSLFAGLLVGTTPHTH